MPIPLPYFVNILRNTGALLIALAMVIAPSAFADTWPPAQGDLVLGVQAESGTGSNTNLFFNLGSATDLRDAPNAGALGNIAAEMTATFGAGCFWGVEKHFQEIPGVRETTVGFTGGTLANPRYKNVCDGGTGHAEAVEIFFDPRAISYEDLVKELFRLHSPGVPSTLRDGQYRTAIFYHDQGQKVIAGKVLAEYERITGGKADVSIVKAGIFFPAEEYHQDYYRKNGGKCPAPVNEQIFSSSPSSR